jgi:hypothetical protein
MTAAYRSLEGKPERKRPFGDLGLSGRIMCMLIFMK